MGQPRTPNSTFSTLNLNPLIPNSKPATPSLPLSLARRARTLLSIACQTLNPWARNRLSLASRWSKGS